MAESKRIAMLESIAADMATFAAKVGANGGSQFKDIGLTGNAATQTARLRTICGIATG